MSNKRVYYRVDLKLDSPLSIGAADSVMTDHDVVLDSRGLPIIPATSLAGVYRSYFDEDLAETYFGGRILDERKKTIEKSTVRVYDAVWIDGNCSVSVRDNVSLEGRVAKTGLKFDRQIVEQGSQFRTYIEIKNAGKCNPAAIEEMLSALDAGELLLGSKSTRGFGCVRVTSCLKRNFDLSAESGMDAWLDFEMFEDDSWNVSLTDVDSISVGAAFNDLEVQRLVIKLNLAQSGAVSVREYSTEPEQPDFSQLYVRGIKDEQNTDMPVIPGTSWAGAFRDRYRHFCGEAQTDRLFGFVHPSNKSDSQPQTAKSRILFSESVLHGGEWKSVTRNSIDRFTGGTNDGALFTMQTYYGGSAKLEITINEDFSEQDIKPLFMVLADLHNGFLSVGGLASVGHGLFRIIDARLAVGLNEYPAFYDELIKPNSEGLSQPNIDAMVDAVMSLVTVRAEGGSHE